jgi:ribosomal protein L32
VYAEFNESEDAARDWELSVEFHPEEREEYKFYIEATRQKQVRPEVPQQKATETRSHKARTHQQLHVSMLQRAREEATRGRASRR